MRQTTTRTRPRADTQRRIHFGLRDKPTPAAPKPPAPPATSAFADDLRDERRARASGGPIDRAQYACSCGYIFVADVSTSVACPHCGGEQAW